MRHVGGERCCFWQHGRAQVPRARRRPRAAGAIRSAQAPSAQSPTPPPSKPAKPEPLCKASESSKSSKTIASLTRLALLASLGSLYSAPSLLYTPSSPALGTHATQMNDMPLDLSQSVSQVQEGKGTHALHLHPTPRTHPFLSTALPSADSSRRPNPARASAPSAVWSLPVCLPRN